MTGTRDEPRLSPGIRSCEGYFLGVVVKKRVWVTRRLSENRLLIGDKGRIDLRESGFSRCWLQADAPIDGEAS